ncbi:hypothetical protein [Methylovirgula sp. 4M-Z18]|uniref:hypothetical protein n=1 Tax=Methylovirgula sp. 4M-Z18 TaxID=2293567 RepID=UPI000E2E60FA|nr:hypothetical protein [Methylovirgula sp. 4M-Z18]RFB75629.1 hypothetical protein DYH55_21520 [Methylovirgula sp. 4M-Z18]
MRTANKRVLTAIVLSLYACAAPAADWVPYGNARFQYWIDIPPDFSAVEESQNGDGGVATSKDEKTELSVWGSYLSDSTFSEEMISRIEQDQADGWNVTYQKRQSNWAVWSGTKGTRIFYERSIPVCAEAAAYYRLEYDKEISETMEKIISRLNRSLRSGQCR